MELDLTCVGSFLTLVEEGHFGRAAERLHITRAALSKRLRRLERQLGTALLVRDAGGTVGATPAGARFTQHAVRLLAAADEARAAAQPEAGPAPLRAQCGPDARAHRGYNRADTLIRPIVTPRQ